jgi:mono/diheme cytochrome c family protein
MAIRNYFWCKAIVLIAALSAVVVADEVPDYSGAELYQHLCASCHGKQARGNGPAAKSLKVPPADLTLISRRHSGTFPTEQLRMFIDGQSMPMAHGSREMPVWGWQLYGKSDEDADRRQRANELIARLVDYLNSIQR